MNGGCTYLDQIHDLVLGCEDCLARGREDWVHLRSARKASAPVPLKPWCCS